MSRQRLVWIAWLLGVWPLVLGATTVQPNTPPATSAPPPTSTATDRTGWGKQWHLSDLTAAVVCAFVDDETIRCINAVPGSRLDFYISRDGGRTFALEDITTGFPANYWGTLRQLIQTQSGRWVLASDSAGANTRITWTDSLAAAASEWHAGAGVTVGTARGLAQGSTGTLLATGADLGTGQAALCRSTDNAVSWTCTPGDNTIWANAQDGVVPVVGSTWLLVRAGGSIGRSTDDGVTWTTVLTPGGGVNGLACVTTTICLVAAGGAGQATLYRSTDGGASWVLQTTFEGPWGSPVGWSVGFANFGSGRVVILQNVLTAGGVLYPQGKISTDFGVTWSSLGAYEAFPPGTNGNGFQSVRTRNGRGFAVHLADTGAIGVYSDVLGAGEVLGRQGQGGFDSTTTPWLVTPVQRSTLFNTSTTGAANTAVSQTIAAAVNQRAHLYHVSAFCSAGSATLTITDGGTTRWQTPTGAVGTSLFTQTFGVGWTGAFNSAVVVTLSACGVGNTGTLNVQADRF